MKLFMIIVLFSFALVLTSYAETDSLVIKLKDGSINKIAVSQIQKIQFENLTGVEDQTIQSNNLTLKGNYPNPFNQLTSIEFEIASSGNVEIMIYDNSGNQIQKLECQDCKAGNNTIQWNCLDNKNKKVQNGVYFYEIKFNNEVQSKKMIMVK